MGEEGGSKIGFSDKMFEGNEDNKFKCRSLVDFLWVEVGIEVVPCDGISEGRDIGELEGLGDI